MTARNRAASGRSAGSSDTTGKHAQPRLEPQAPARIGVSHQDPVNGHRSGPAQDQDEFCVISLYPQAKSI
jgi:hypothetical protein